MNWSGLKSAARALPFVESAWGRGRSIEQALRYRFFARENAAQAGRLGLVYSEAGVQGLLRARLARRGLSVTPRAKGDLRILWVGAYEPSDRSGTVQALERLGTVTCFAGSEGYGPARGGKWDENGAALVAAYPARAQPTRADAKGFARIVIDAQSVRVYSVRR